MSTENFDFAIIGAGVVGLNLAIRLKQKDPSFSILVLDKEGGEAFHASGRNSGVLHAGFYYTPDSLKARFTKEGNQAWRHYCEERKLAMNPCGKLVVARNKREDETLQMLFDRCKLFGIDAKLVDEKEARELEPRVKTYSRALWSPTSYSVDPKQIMASRLQDAKNLGIKIHFSEAFVSFSDGKLKTSKEIYNVQYLINCAGAYADKIAKTQALAKNYRVLPYKGLYLKSSEEPGKLRRHIYPVPDLRNPFLGVHFTLTSKGDIKIGPTATPAFWREQYGGMAGFSLSEFAESSLGHLKLCTFGPKQIRRLAWEELLKLFRSHLVSSAVELAENVKLSDYSTWGHPGIRAQIVDTKENKLVMDFLTEENENSFHVLNSISPAFTSAIPFCDYIANKVEERFKSL